MLQNMKVDMVYYRTNTDFELEFNLCGCCRMRLLNGKANDRKSLIALLSRAVSRSTVIFTVGPLFGPEGLIACVSKIIGKKVEPIDNHVYGIRSEEPFFVIESSVPLVTSDGRFGGCIIESGPQTMILLSDHKVVRKSIMSNLIHPYIEELSTMRGNVESVVMTKETENEEPQEEYSESSESEETDSLPEPEQEKTSPQQDVESENLSTEPIKPESIKAFNSAQIEIQGDEGMIFEPEEETKQEDYTMPEEEDFFVESESVKKSREKSRQSAYNFGETEEEGDFHTDSNPADFPKPASLFSGHFMFLVIITTLFIGVVILAYSLIYVPLHYEISPFVYLREIFQRLFG
ncbi:MAG: hypothetical protein IJT66_06410 [Clostridia bacterium]|nr:hypothetical protein [Clostridia bacterium]